MKHRLSTRLEGVAESSTLKMNAMARELAAKGVKVINLTAGEPDFPVPSPVKEAASRAIAENFSRYTPVAGIPELRKAIAAKLSAENGLNYAPEDVVVTVGAKQAIFNFLLAVISPGDEVVIPAPYWVSYPEMVRLAGGIPVIVEAKAGAGFKITGAQLKKALSPRTRAFILNSPSNPTGATYTREEMTDLARSLEGTEVLAVSDEIYEKLLFKGEFTSFAALSRDAFERTVTVNGFSKAYAMTGWRLGYAAGPREIISAMALLQGQSTSNAASLVQKAALAALQLREDAFRPMVDAFRRRRDRMAEIFSRCRDFSFVVPDGAFYFFLDVEALYGRRYNDGQGLKTLRGSEDLAFHLLDSTQVVTVPGAGFGADGYLRLSFAVSDAEVEEGARRLVDAAAALQP